jgi:hypothetical protein
VAEASHRCAIRVAYAGAGWQRCRSRQRERRGGHGHRCSCKWAGLALLWHVGRDPAALCCRSFLSDTSLEQRTCTVSWFAISASEVSDLVLGMPGLHVYHVYGSCNIFDGVISSSSVPLQCCTVMLPALLLPKLHQKAPRRRVLYCCSSCQWLLLGADACCGRAAFGSAAICRALSSMLWCSLARMVQQLSHHGMEPLRMLSNNVPRS